MAIIMIQGYLKKRAMQSGKNWKRRYFMLTTDGELQFCEKKGSPIKGSIQITKHTSISVLRELGEEGGICITGPDHEPMYLQAESQEVAEGWIQAMEVIKAGGSNQLKAHGREHKQGEDLRAFVKRDVFGTGNRARKDTMERRLRGTRKGAKAESYDSATEEEDAEDDMIASEMEDYPDELDGTDNELDDDDADSAVDDGADEDVEGYIMRIGKKDYFVDAVNWNYYKDRSAFQSGKKPLGRAVLSNLV
ncbi:Unconventional myosin-X [Hondaea fermentalgiana]|uniref:Unconventional myosin-X n=1 Tax=Hondaea fermentalgiana TaxID=2315210 RepID=A0A2R5GFG6_9STRA|nr:Unconventional myosin-X [Hondaea fermentalgiana]|eukprot:GBG26991.1 Unconventional myosin-X [Hondaea fermentalgiana]